MRIIFRDLPLKATFRFKNCPEVMEKHTDNTCGFRWTADGLYPVNPEMEVEVVHVRSKTE